MSSHGHSNPDPPSRRGRVRVAAWVAMLLLLAALGAFALYRPAGNADLVDYVATAHSWEGLSGQALSDATYADLRAFLTPGQFDNVTGAGDRSLQRNIYLHTMATDPVSLAQQIPFYSVKPIYPVLMLALHALGIPLPLSTVLISVAASTLLGLLVFGWMQRHHRPLMALLLAGLIVTSPPFAALESLSTPDALGLLLMTSAAFAFAELRRPPLAAGLLVLALLARPNAAIFALLLIGACVVGSRASGVRVRPWFAVGAGVTMIAVVGIVSRLVGAYPYPTLFADALLGYLPYPANGAPPISLRDLVRLYLLLAAQVPATLIPLMSLLALIALRLRVDRLSSLRDDPLSLLLVVAVVAMAAGWLIFPNEPDRILVGSYLVVVVVLAASAGRSRSASSGEAPAPMPLRQGESAA